MYTALTMNNPGIRGNTDASAMRRPSTPCTLSLESTTLPSPALPMGQVQEA
jgi:hypothetical protein